MYPYKLLLEIYILYCIEVDLHYSDNFYKILKIKNISKQKLETNFHVFGALSLRLLIKIKYYLIVFMLIIFENLPILFQQILKLTVLSRHYSHFEIIMVAAIIKNH